MIQIVASLAKRFRIVAENRLNKFARSVMTVERFSTELVEFSKFLNKFIEAADEDQKGELKTIANTLQQYGQTIVSIANAFDRKNIEEASVGFESINDKVEKIETAIEFLKLDDSEALIALDGKQEFDIEEKIQEILDLGKSVVKDKLTDEQLAVVKEIEEENETDSDASEIANMLGYRSESGGNSFEEEAQREGDKRRELKKNRHKIPLKIQKMRSLEDIKTQEEFLAKKEKYLKALEDYLNKIKQWKSNYYRNVIKPSPKYENLIKKNDSRDIERIDSYHKINSLSLTPEELYLIETTAVNEPKKLINVSKVTGKKKVPAKELWDKVQKDREQLGKLKIHNPDLFDKIKEKAEVHFNRRERQSKRYEQKEKSQIAVKNEKQKDKRREKALEDLMKKINKGVYF